MAFMVPEITGKELWYAVEGNCGTDFVPADISGTLGIKPGETIGTDDPGFDAAVKQLGDYVESKDIDSIEAIEGYGVRLQAPGYMDSTEWTVFGTEAEAEEHLIDTYDFWRCPSCKELIDSQDEDAPDDESTPCASCIAEQVEIANEVIDEIIEEEGK